MRILIVGVGALGGVIGTRLVDHGVSVTFAARDARAADALRRTGLRVSGIGGVAVSATPDMRAIADVPDGAFDLVVLATKADDALAAAPACLRALAPGGVLLPIQNGAVAQVLAEHHGEASVLGGLSNLGATMHAPGNYEQRNDGHLLVGELASMSVGKLPGGSPDRRSSDRVERVREILERGVRVRTTPNMTGAIWSKLLLNCSVTTLGAIAGMPMRAYVARPEGRALLDRTYDEALAVARASGVVPERMLVEPVPPAEPAARDAWVSDVLASYGDLKPSMLQDFERGRPTEIDYINGYIAGRGRALGVPVPINAAIVETVRAISRGAVQPGFDRLPDLLRAASG